MMIAEAVLFTFIYLQHVPEFNPCTFDPKTNYGHCFAVPARPAYDQLIVKDFQSKDDVLKFVRDTGYAGHLIDFTTGKRSYVSATPVYKTVSKEEQELDYYEPKETP